MSQNDQKKQQSQVEPIQHLVAELEQSREFYETAVQNAQQSMLKDMLEQRAQQRAGFIAELAEYLEEYDVAEPEAESAWLSLSEGIQRGLMTIKAAMTIERDETDETLLQECQAAEKRLLATYQETLHEADLSPPATATLRHQYSQIQAAHAYIDSFYARPDWAIALGLFAKTAVHQEAVAALEGAGFTEEEIGVVQEQDATDLAESLREDVQQTTRETAKAGALGGSAVGTLFGLTAGAGVALVTGPLLPALGIAAIGTGIGATYGGIFGSLIGMGIGEEDVQRYLEGMRRGETLVAIKTTPERAAEAAGILREHEARAVMTRHDSFGTELFD